MLAPILPPATYLVDEMVDCYVEWRECAAAVATAYRRWSDAPPGERHRWYSGYTASLDQEQSAATSYERAASDVQQRLHDARGGRSVGGPSAKRLKRLFSDGAP